MQRGFMFKNFGINETEVRDFMNGKDGKVRDIITKLYVVANEGDTSSFEKAEFDSKDAKIISNIADEYAFRAEILASMLPANESPNWIVELFTEDKTAWISEIRRASCRERV